MEGLLPRLKFMPMHLELDREAGLARTTLTGTITMSDIRRHLAAVLDRKVFLSPELIDARAVDQVRFGSRDLLQIADLVRQGLSLRPMPPRAVVVSGESHFGQARVFAAFVAGWMRMAVFDDMDAAVRWLADAAVDVPSVEEVS